MAYFQILGTGPSTPITNAEGRNYRRRSSALMQHISTYLLVDATHDFDEQVERALSVTAVVTVNSSRDAAGGLGNLDRWTTTELPVCVPTDLWQDLVERYGPFTNLVHSDTPPLVATPVGDLSITPFPVEVSAGAEPGRVTYGYRFDTGKKKICYASDLKHVPPASAPLLRNNDLLVVDAAGWDKDLPTHRGALNHIHEYVSGDNADILFTHIGRSAPPHSEANAVVRRVSYTARVAFDFMKIPLGR